VPCDDQWDFPTTFHGCEVDFKTFGEKLSRKNVHKGREDANEEKSLPYTDVGCSHRNILKALRDLARNFPSFILCLHILKFRKHWRISGLGKTICTGVLKKWKIWGQRDVLKLQNYTCKHYIFSNGGVWPRNIRWHLARRQYLLTHTLPLEEQQCDEFHPVSS